MPIRSASLNLTPGRSSRSSSSTSMPAACSPGTACRDVARCVSSLQLTAIRCTWNGAMASGQMMPLASWFCSTAAAAVRRDADAVAAHLHRLLLAVRRPGRSRSSPRCTWCRGRRPGRPRCRGGSRARPSSQRGQGSPARATRRSANAEVGQDRAPGRRRSSERSGLVGAGHGAAHAAQRRGRRGCGCFRPSGPAKPTAAPVCARTVGCIGQGQPLRSRAPCAA